MARVTTMNSTDSTDPTKQPDGIVLFAHGSRDPLWKQPIEAVAAQIQRSQPKLPVACAYLELSEPSLPDAAAQMITALQSNTMKSIANSVDSIPAICQKRLKIRILPMFLGMGKHAREDLPQLATQLRAQHSEVEFDIAPAVGEDPRVTQLLAMLAVA
jgi:sirohydrochlorin cobaltochelatase